MNFRIFTAADQISFAELSGDYNPVHTDDIAARRLLFGATVVHGIHALLWSLDCCLKERIDSVEIRSIKASFAKPIYVGDAVQMQIHRDGGNVRLHLLRGESIVTKIKLELRDVVQEKSEFLRSGFPEKIEPRALRDDEIETASGALDLYLDATAAGNLFPNLARCLSPLQIAVLLSTTRLVGVNCPGLHSVFSELVLSAIRPVETTTLQYETTSYDRRVNLVAMKISSPDMAGTIHAFRRPEPECQPNCRTLRGQVVDGEFAGQRALVVGGSRGLGEVAAKLLACGGADVRLTYHQGKADARRIVDDIVSNGGLAKCFCFDVLNPRMGAVALSENGWTPTHLYYFATPFIFSGIKGTFSYALFRKFCDYYIDGFVNTVNQMRKCRVAHVFYPSTIAIDELPGNMGEYSAAKAASESVCRSLAKSNRDLNIYQPRFPRMATDQTVSIMPVVNHNPVPIMTRELRHFRGLAAEK